MSLSLPYTWTAGELYYQDLNTQEQAIRDYINNNMTLLSDVSDTAIANKLLKLNSSAKLPASITGNCDGVAAHATSLSGGANGSIPYQSASGTTALLAAGTAEYLLQANGAAAPSWIKATNAVEANTILKRDTNGDSQLRQLTLTATGDTASLIVSNTKEITNLRSAYSTNLYGGAAGKVPYQSASNTTLFLDAGTSTQVLGGGATAPAWVNFASENTVSSLVYRDSSGDFSARNININSFTSNSASEIKGVLTIDPPIVSGTQTGIILKENGSGATEGLSIDWMISEHGSVSLASIVSSTRLTGADLSFRTNPADSGTPIERLRIDNDGKINVLGQIASTVTDGTAPFTVLSTTPVANLSIGGNAATATTATNATTATLAEAAKGDTRFQISGSIGGNSNLSVPALTNATIYQVCRNIPLGKSLVLKRVGYVNPGLSANFRIKTLPGLNIWTSSNSGTLGTEETPDTVLITASEIQLTATIQVMIYNSTGSTQNVVPYVGFWADLSIE